MVTASGTLELDENFYGDQDFDLEDFDQEGFDIDSNSSANSTDYNEERF